MTKETKMTTIRRSETRGKTRIDWLDSRHTFSFGDYYDPGQVGFRQLRVINEDRVKPGAGFPTHSHRDMEIISYVLEGALQHKDSLGNGSIIRPGDIQRMSAGRGITHSEFNSSPNEPVHFLQIWIMPAQTGIPPSYEQQKIDLASARANFRVIASPQGGPGVVKLHQDAAMSVAFLDTGEELTHRLAERRHGWLQLARGSITLNGDTLNAGDGAAIDAGSALKVVAQSAAELVLLDLA
jgi:redox-sensitive bicupin YhaK (pirin superfamily)